MSYVNADSLPEGWVLVRASEVCDINPRKPAANMLAADAAVTFVPMAAVDENLGAITKREERRFGELRPKSFTPFAEGDVLFAKITPCMENGKAAVARGLANGTGFGSTEFHVLRPTEAVLPEYVYHYVRQQSFRDDAQGHMAGAVGQLRVPSDYVKQFELPLPPLAEQERIVAKVEALLSRVRSVRQRLAAVPYTLKRFRQAVLAHACSGKLIEDWRALSASMKNAVDLVQQIRAHRARSAKTKREQSTIEKLRNLRLQPLNDSELPDTWCACHVNDAGLVCNGSTPSRKNPDFWGGDIPWVSSGEVRNNRISVTREQITKTGLDGSSVRLLPAGTVLIAMIGEGKTRGQTAILDIEATTNQNIAAVVLDHGLVVPEYLWFWFQLQYEDTRQSGGGSGQKALNCQRVRELPLVLPPLDEQREIVRRVEALFALADSIEQRVQAAIKRAEALTQSILAKAFRGEMVPTEADLARAEGRDYETAEQLLTRIRQDLAQPKPQKKRKVKV